jgi:NAD(P)-dependent dehydrogenase (short-subunit alcohol dehydrogenase family)
MGNIFRIDNKVAVIIGGTGGIGEVLARGLSEFGAKVVIVGRNVERATVIAGEISSQFPQSAATAMFVDISNEHSISDLRDKIASRFGTVDILVNAHGINIKKNATEFSIDEWDYLFNVNVRGTMLACREFGKMMIEQNKGKVINFSSVRGLRATTWSGNEGYTATKAAIDMITRSLASEWAPFGINVNAIAPSTVATRFSESTLNNPEKMRKFLERCPLGRVAQPADMVGACIFLSSSASDYITGQILYVDGGMTAIG